MKIKHAVLILRIGLGFAFLYASISSFLNPNNWIGFFPLFLRNLINENLLLNLLSVYQLFLGLWLFSGKYNFYSAIVSSATLFGIVIFNLGTFDIVFRDISLLFSSIALAILTKSLNRK